MTNTVKRILDDIRDLAPGITSRVAEVEAGREIPSDLMKALKSIGIFRMCMPQSHGGLDLDLPALLEIIRVLGKIDGSIGWTAMISGGGGFIYSFFLCET